MTVSELKDRLMNPNSFGGSIFTRDEVIGMLDGLTNMDIDYGRLQAMFERAMMNDQGDVIEYDSAEFELDHNNKVVLNSVDINYGTIAENLVDIVRDA